MLFSINNRNILYSAVLFIAVLAVFSVLSSAAEDKKPAVSAIMLDSSHGLITFPYLVTLNDTATITIDADDTAVKSYILPADGGKVISFYLTNPLLKPARITIKGDLFPVNAADDNPIVKNLLVMPSIWPANRKNLVFLWETNISPNLVLFTDNIYHTPCRFNGEESVFDNKGRIKCNAGIVKASEIVSKAAINACRKNKAFSFEMTVTASPANSVLFTIGNITLRTDKNNFQLDLPDVKKNVRKTIKAGSLQVAVYTAYHILITIDAYQATAYQNGELTAKVMLPKNWFTNWTGADIITGTPVIDDNQQGAMEAFAVYSRVLTAEEAKSNADAANHRMLPMETEKIVVKAKLTAMTITPLPKDILPYKHALVTHKYQVTEVVKGYKTTVNKDAYILVARWGILSAKQTAIAEMKIGDQCELTLENFKDHPELERQYTVDNLTDEYELPYLLDVKK